MKSYAGIGSRRTPDDVMDRMQAIADRLAKAGWTLRTGGAVGADFAFAVGAQLSSDELVVFRPEDATREAILRAEEVHPAWHRCSDWARRAHGRNVMIVLGQELNDPVKFVVCWTPGGNPVGGTATGIRIAEAAGIPVFNLWDDVVEWRLSAFVEKLSCKEVRA